MKKFTRNFLFDEHGLGGVLRKVGLSMVAILFSFAVMAQGEPQETYHVWADSVNECYRYDNTYEVDIYMRDFVKIDTFQLVLDFQSADGVFTYLGVDLGTDLNVQAVLGNGRFSDTEVDGNTLRFNWGCDDPVTQGTIGETPEETDMETKVFTLRFKLDDYPHSYGPVPNNSFGALNNLKWIESAIGVQFGSGSWFYNNSNDDITDILTDWNSDGTLLVTQNWDDIDLNIDKADCDGGNALVEVTTPADEYSYNGETFSSNAVANVQAPSEDNTIRIKQGGCVSYFQSFEVKAQELLVFGLSTTANCPDGLGDIHIEATGGRTDYRYFVVSEQDWNDEVNAALTGAGTQAEALAVAADYEVSNDVVEREVGIYYVAVQDANECADLRRHYDEAVWQMVEVVNEIPGWELGDEYGVISCNGGTTFLSLDFSGATPYENDEYDVYVNDMYKGRVASPYMMEAVLAGTYNYTIIDSKGCKEEVSVTIGQPAPIEFVDLLDHTDVGCGLDTGMVWITDVQGLYDGDYGGTFEGGAAGWWIDTMPDLSTAWFVGGIEDTAKGLKPQVYYAKIVDDNGCEGVYENINTDNAIKVLTYEYELVYEPIKCYRGSTEVTLEITGENRSHDFDYTVNRVQGMGFITPVTGTENSWILSAGRYRFTLIDNTIGCEVSWVERIVQPDPLRIHVVDLQTVPPSCPGETDGTVVVRANPNSSGTPFAGGLYEFKMDDNDWVQPSAYNGFLTGTDAHTIYIKDAMGCVDSTIIDFADGENMIDFVDEIHTECAGSEINLFNRYPDGEDCNPYFDGVFNDVNDNGQFEENIDQGPYRFWSLNSECMDIYEQGDLGFVDQGYINGYSFYGIPMEQFTGAWTSDISIWTSDSGWVSRTLHGAKQLRDPKLYITTVDPQDVGANVVATGDEYTWTSSIGDGKYWLVTKDEWGCYSNIEMLEVIDPKPLRIEVSAVNAGCDGATDGLIMVEAFNGRFDLPGDDLQWPSYQDNRYQYVISSNPDIFEHPNWLEQVRWLPFSNVLDHANDSVLALNAQDDTYYLAIRDWCGIENPALIQFDTVTVGGLDAVNNETLVVTNITCHKYVLATAKEYCNTTVSADNGSISNVIGGTSGGSESFTATLVKGGISYTYDADEDGFFNLDEGIYTLTITDTDLGCEFVTTKTITQPEALIATVDVVNPSCFENHDGILRYKIAGGTAPYMEITENFADGFENIGDIPDERWVSVENEGWISDTEIMDRNDHLNEVEECGYMIKYDVRVFDRRVRADHKQIWVKDANDCIYGPIEVEIKEPGELVINYSVKNVDCNDYAADDDGYLEEGNTDNGSITINPTGGWDEVDGFKYYATLYSSTGVPLETIPFDTLPDSDDPIRTFTGLYAGDYSVKLFEYNKTMANDGYAMPITMYSDPAYFDDQNTWGQYSPFQNPDTLACFATVDVTVEEPPVITYNADWNNVTCYNTASGSIDLTKISGGIAGSYGYWVGLQGPQDFDASAITYPAGTDTKSYDNISWFTTTDSAFTFNNLPYGHYTIHLMDDRDCWMFKESGEIQNVDSLEIIVLEKLEDAMCFGGKGKVEIHATGGIDEGNYMYAVDSTLTPSPGSHLFPDMMGMDSDEYLKGLKWQDTAVFDVTAAETWVAFVMDKQKYDADEYDCVTGFSTDIIGTPILQHRTTILQPDPIEVVDTDETPVTCYGYDNGEILVDEIIGGNGATWSITVSGLAFNDMMIDTTYVSDLSEDLVLKGLYASKTEYNIVVKDVMGCESIIYTQEVTQPEPFVVTLEDKQNNYICPNDQAGLYEIRVVQGGVPFDNSPDGPVYEYVWDVYGEDGVRIDSLSDDVWGSTRTFNGYGNLRYVVTARDAKDCETQIDTFITAPLPMEIMVEDITCDAEAPKASARIWPKDKMTNGRTWRLFYRELEQESNPLEPKELTPYGEWNQPGDFVDMLDTLVFDVENVQDVHYEFILQDSLGCWSTLDTMTFDREKVDGFEVTEWSETADACGVDVSFNSSSDGVLEINNVEIADVTAGMNNFRLTEEGSHMIRIASQTTHCAYYDTVVVAPVVMVVEEEYAVFTGDSIVFVNSDYGVDTVLYEGVHTARVDSPIADACFVDLTVTITGYDRPVAMLDTVYPGDTIETSHPLFEMVFENAPTIKWNGDAGTNYYLTVTEKDSATATLMIPLEESMISDNVVTVDYDGAVLGYLGLNTTYVVTVDSGAIWSYSDVVEDFGMAWDPAEIGTWMFTTGDSVMTDINTPLFNGDDFKVYPNPFNDYIRVDNYDKLSRVVITNIAGQRVLDIENPRYEIRTGNLVTGVYVVTLIQNNNIVKSERIIKR